MDPRSDVIGCLLLCQGKAFRVGSVEAGGEAFGSEIRYEKSVVLGAQGAPQHVTPQGV